MAEFIHLHNHSYYSLLDGLSSPADMAKHAASMGQKALAITDHGSCAGLYNFQKACQGEGIKPILGMEAYITPDMSINCKEKNAKDSKTWHLVLLAKNKVGYHNLIRLSSLGYLEGFYRKPRIDFDLLEQHKEGLIVSTACCVGELGYYLSNKEGQKALDMANQYKEAFGDDFYLEIMTHKYFEHSTEQQEKEKKLASAIYKLGQHTGIKCIASQDAHYTEKRLWASQDVLLAHQTHNHIKNPNRMSFWSDDFYLKSSEEMEILYGHLPELLSNTLEIAEKIEENIIVPDEDLLPYVDLPEGIESENDYLKKLVTEGMKRHGLIDNAEYRERVQYEMGVIADCGYVRYFLILWDVINFCKNEDIRVGIGRGSAAGSVILYVLDIVKIDPIKYGLIFERFLNPERVSPPDVDLDFDFVRRSEVHDYFRRKYGDDHCSHIGTYNGMKARATVKNVTKALDLGNDWEIYQKMLESNPNQKAPTTKNSLDKADKISKMIDKTAPVNVTLEQAVEKFPDLKNVMARYPELYKHGKILEGTLSSAGVHASGLIAIKNPVIDHIPLKKAKGIISSQYDGPEVEDLGLLKFDILGLKTLTVVDRTLKMIYKRTGKQIDIDHVDPDADVKIYSIFDGSHKTMDTKGIFQFESPGMMKLLKNMKTDRFEDLIVANALYRPGPLGAGVHDMYCDYKHGRKVIEYLHPKMEDVLKDTCGVIAYQETVMKLSQVLAGYSLGQADILRKAMGKKKQDIMDAQKDKFVNGCVENDISKKVALEVWSYIDKFAGYGFNKSHSACYAYLAYQTAYLKYYYPLEFMCNLLTGEIGDDDQMSIYIRAAQRMGIKIAYPDINKSGMGFIIDEQHEHGKLVEVLRPPLTATKGIGVAAVQEITDKQPFKNLKDFLSRVDGRKVTSKVFKALIDNGSTDIAWEGKRAQFLSEYDVLKKQISKEKKDMKKQEEALDEFEGASLFEGF